MRRPSRRERHLFGLSGQGSTLARSGSGPAWWRMFAVLAGCGVILYAQTLDVPWYMDDTRAIVNHPAVHDLGRAVSELLAPRGIVTFTFALNAYVGGLDPAGFHLVNIVLHIATSGLMLLVLRRVFAEDWVALGAALLFLVHPLQTAAVTYTVQRMTVLSGFFSLLGVWCYLRGREACAAGGRVCNWFTGAAMSAVLAVAAKQNAALWPLAVGLLETLLPDNVRNWPSERQQRLRRGRIVITVIFALVVAVLAWRDLLLPALRGAPGLHVGGEDVTGSGPVSPMRYLVSQGPVLWFYLRLLFFPLGQALDHGWPPVATLDDPLALWAWGGLLALGAAAWWQRRRLPVLAVAVGWFFLTLAVESSLIPLDPVFEHRLYLPVLAVALLFGTALQQRPSPRQRGLLAIVILVPLVLLTWQRNALWREPAALWSDNLRVAPGSSRVFVNAAIEAARSGDQARARAIVDEYLPRFAGRERLRNNPKFLLNVGLALRGAGDETAAELYLRRAISLAPGFALAHYNLGTLLHDRGEHAEAALALQQAAQLEPANLEYRFAAAVVRLGQGDETEARRILPQLLALSPQRGQQLRQRLQAARSREGGR